MPIVGFNLTNLQAQKTKPLESKEKELKIQSKLGITAVKEEKLPTGKTKTDGLRFDFEFKLDYQPGIAKIAIEGFMYYMDDPKILKEITDQWKKEKNIPLDVKTQLLNTVVLRASIKALQLEQEINVPPHMPFPSVKPVTRGKDYIG
ncbi:MAG: hypothetical protein ABIB47_06220 [Candidatus Woesearchaeota archaeon]